MNPLHVDITAPSSSGSNGTYYEGAVDRPGSSQPYPQVAASEILFPDFQHLKRLGRGAYGTVVQAYYKNKVVAVKLVETDIDQVHIHNEAKFLHEFQHENIVKFYALFQGDQTGLILELMEGGSLHELLHQHQHIQYFACHALGWAQQVASALSFLHKKGYVHRDLKPSNMLLTNDYITLKLCDFGTATELRTSMTNNRGSAAWMAPEVFRGKKYDQKCDIFSFGILLWEIVTRRQPFADWNDYAYTILWQVSEGRRPSTPIFGCPEPVVDLMKRCWSDNPKERPGVEEVQSTIEILCEIYPNRYLPLIDKTTKKQALAQPHRNQFYSSGHSYSPSTPRANHIPNGPPPIPPPPQIQLPPHHAYSSSDFSQRSSQDWSPPIHNSYSGSDMTSRFGASVSINQPSPYEPYSTNSPSPYTPYTTPLPNASPYTPCVSALPPMPPPSQPCTSHDLSPASNPSYHLNDSSPGLQPAGEIGWRRSSEPPTPSDTDSAYGSHEEKRKKSHGIKKFFSGLKKEFDKK
jgi:serine/threonine protein kinase